MFAPRLNSRPNGCVISLSSAPCKHHVLSADSHRQTHGLASFGHNSLGGAAIDMLRRRISVHGHGLGDSLYNFRPRKGRSIVVEIRSIL